MEVQSPKPNKRRLSKKARGFVNDIADGVPGVHAALNNYDTDDYRVANAIAVENLQKPAIVDALKELGFDSNNAKRVVAEILNNESVEENHRLNAAEKVFKVNGDYAPEKTLNMNIDAQLTKDEGELASVLIELLS